MTSLYPGGSISNINPLTALLAAPSLGKRPTEVPNLKSLRLFSIFARAHERTSIKIHSTESRVVKEPSNIIFSGVYMSTSQPGNCTGWGSEWVKNCRSHCLPRPRVAQQRTIPTLQKSISFTLNFVLSKQYVIDRVDRVINASPCQGYCIYTAAER